MIISLPCALQLNFVAGLRFWISSCNKLLHVLSCTLGVLSALVDAVRVVFVAPGRVAGRLTAAGVRARAALVVVVAVAAALRGRLRTVAGVVAAVVTPATVRRVRWTLGGRRPRQLTRRPPRRPGSCSWSRWCRPRRHFPPPCTKMLQHGQSLRRFVQSQVRSGHG